MTIDTGDVGGSTPVTNQMPLERLLGSVLESDGFVLYAQPILNLETFRFDQYELLPRLVDEQGRLVPPGEFLPVAQRAGLTRSIDRWVLRHAIDVLARQCGDVVLEVNVAGSTLVDEELAGWVHRRLADAGVNGSNLVLEITETAAVSDLPRAQRCLEKLKAMGCRFALDDFGVGFASFHYLKHLSVDYVKIDGSFIRDLSRNRLDACIVKAIVEVASELGIQTIAECVEDPQTLEKIRQLGVDLAQGYYVGPPMPLSTVVPEPFAPFQPAEGLPA